MSVAAEALHIDRQQHVVQHAPPGEQDGRLEDHADVTARSHDGSAAKVHLAVRRRQDAGQDLEERGLSAARRSDDCDKLTFAHFETDLLERVHAAITAGIALREFLDGDDFHDLSA